MQGQQHLFSARSPNRATALAIKGYCAAAANPKSAFNNSSELDEVLRYFQYASSAPYPSQPRQSVGRTSPLVTSGLYIPLSSVPTSVADSATRDLLPSSLQEVFHPTTKSFSNFAMSNSTQLFLDWEGQIVPRAFSPGYVALSYLVSYVGAWTTLELINKRTAVRGLYNWYIHRR